MNERIEKFLEQVKVNERIEALAEQAGCKIDRLGYGEGNLEKFAELIVRECATVVEDSPWNLPQGYKSVDQAKLVKKHFGVE